MKKLVLGAFVLGTALFSTVNAQTQKGNLLVGGNVGNVNFGVSKGSTTSVNITPKAAYFFKDNVAVGGYADLGFAKVGDGPSAFTYAFGALGRYYLASNDLPNFSKHGNFFLEGNLGLGGDNSTQKDGSNSVGFNYGIGPGYAYFLTKNVGLEGLLKFTGNLGGGNSGATGKLVFGLGFQVYLPAKKVEHIIKEETK
ncbi:MAG: hypothetical protein FDW93_03855 [Bergeyella sp.]|nr:hypothetical protein [Bergeyella sp.]